MLEVLFDSMLLFVALRAMMKDKDDEMGKKRGKRKNKYKPDYNKEAEALDVMSKDKRKKKKDKDEDYIPMAKRIENYKLPPAREVQEGHI